MKKVLIALSSICLVILFCVVAMLYFIPSTEKIDKTFNAVLVHGEGEVTPCEVRLAGEYMHWFFGNENDRFKNNFDDQNDGLFVNGKQILKDGGWWFTVEFMPDKSGYSSLMANGMQFIMNKSLDCVIIDKLYYDFESDMVSNAESGEECLLVAPASDIGEAAEQIKKLINDESDVYSLWKDELSADLWKSVIA